MGFFVKVIAGTPRGQVRGVTTRNSFETKEEAINNRSDVEYEIMYKAENALFMFGQLDASQDRAVIIIPAALKAKTAFQLFILDETDESLNA